MVAYQPLGSDSFQFLLRSTGVATTSYVAVGLSDDAQMGDDLVFTCLSNNSVSRCAAAST